MVRTQGAAPRPCRHVEPDVDPLFEESRGGEAEGVPGGVTLGEVRQTSPVPPGVEEAVLANRTVAVVQDQGDPACSGLEQSDGGGEVVASRHGAVLRARCG